MQYRGLRSKAAVGDNSSSAEADSNFNIFNASNCSIETPHKVLRCYTIAGAGGGLKWRVVVDEQDSVNPSYVFHRDGHCTTCMCGDFRWRNFHSRAPLLASLRRLKLCSIP